VPVDVLRNGVYGSFKSVAGNWFVAVLCCCGRYESLGGGKSVPHRELSAYSVIPVVSLHKVRFVS